MVVIIALFLLVFILTISGTLNLIISVFLIKFKRPMGKTLFTIGLVCLIPFFWLYINKMQEEKQDWDNLSPLVQAIYKHNYKKVTKCIQEGYNVNEINPYTRPSKGSLVYLFFRQKYLDSRTPLTYAIIEQDFEITKLLVENGADVNLESVGRKPLEHAILTKNIEIVRFLLENGADMVPEDEEEPGKSTLSFAIRMDAGDEIIDLITIIIY